MKKLLYCLLILSVNISVLNAQQTERDANFHFKQMNYAVALKLYKQLYQKDSTNEEINYRLGICLLNCNSNPASAYKYLTKAATKYQGDALFQLNLAKAYLNNYDFNNCREALKKTLSLGAKDTEIKNEADLLNSMANNAERMVKNPLDVSFVNLGKSINSEMDELTPVITPDNNLLFYTSNRSFDNNLKLYTYDVFFSEFEDGNFKKGKPATTINSLDDEFVAGMSNSGERMFYQLQGYEAFEDLMVTDIIKNNVKGKVLLSSSVNSKTPERGAAETQSGDTLFFSSEREDGLGGSDLFYSLKLPNGEWSQPRSLGNEINTLYNEDFPVLSADGTKLYFCSNGPESMGGYDIFVSSINPVTRELSKPRNIGYPLNDVLDNQTIALSDDGNAAYVSAIRPDGFGYNDLYRVIFNQNDPTVKIFQVKLTTMVNNQPVEWGAQDSTLRITVLNKTKHLFGKYAYYPKTSQATVALPPGTYYLEIEGSIIEPYSTKISVPEIPGAKKIETLTVVLVPKK